MDANHHYILARDQDGLPLRCITSLEEAYQRPWRDATQQSVLLVDGPAVLRTNSRHGILDGHLFHDNVHPTLIRHIALAEAVLATASRPERAFDWPASTPAPDNRPRNDVPMSWASVRSPGAAVCERSAVYYGQLALLPSDSAERAEWRDRYATAARQIRAGGSLKMLAFLESGSALASGAAIFLDETVRIGMRRRRE